MAAISSSILLGRSNLREGYKVEFYNENEKVVAKVFHTNKKIGKCVLEGLSVLPWTYEKLPDSARSKVNQVLKEYGLRIEQQGISIRESDKKVKQLFSKTPNANCLNEDSDEEFTSPDSQGNVFVFKKSARTPVSSMTIPCADHNIKGSTLIEIAHNKIQAWYEEGVNLCCEYEKDIGGTILSPPEERDGLLIIDKPTDWILTLGGWKGMIPREEVKEYFIYSFNPEKAGKKFNGVNIYKNGLMFPIIEGRIHLSPGFSIRHFDVTTSWEKRENKWVAIPSGKTDLSYPQIVKAIETIKKSFKWSDSKIAILQLCALSRSIDFPSWFERIPKENQREILQFLDYLNGLMFGIEASGLNAAIAISLMTLDLIVYGHLDYQIAFKANEDGGVYPYACFGNNSGTYSAREKILLHKKENRNSYSMKEFRENTSLSPVATKEAILIKNWLDCHEVTLEKETNIPQSEQLKLIEQAIEDLIKCYFSPWLSKPNYFLKKFLEKKDS